jgi:hypothetical protein
MSRSSAAALDIASNDSSGNDSSGNDDAIAAQPTWAEDKNPTRPLPTFRLEEEARRLDLAAASASERDDQDATVTVSAEENKKLLASVFAAAAAGGINQDAIETLPGPIDDPEDHPANAEDPTLDASPPSPPSSSAQVSAAMSRPVTVSMTARPPALKMLVITRPAPAHAPRSSVTPSAVVSPAGVSPPIAFPRTAPAFVMSLAPAPAPAVLVAPPPSGVRARITPELARTARDLRAVEDRRQIASTFAIRRPLRNVQNYVVAGIWAMALSLLAVLMFMATWA